MSLVYYLINKISILFKMKNQCIIERVKEKNRERDKDKREGERVRPNSWRIYINLHRRPYSARLACLSITSHKIPNVCICNLLRYCKYCNL